MAAGLTLEQTIPNLYEKNRCIRNDASERSGLRAEADRYGHGDGRVRLSGDRHHGRRAGHAERRRDRR